MLEVVDESAGVDNMKITAHYDCGCTWLDGLGAFLKTVDKSRRKPVETVKSLMVRRTGTKKEA